MNLYLQQQSFYGYLKNLAVRSYWYHYHLFLEGSWEPLEQLAGSGHLSHLLGIQVFLDAQNYTPADCSLGQAAFQVAMRQEIGISFSSHRPVLSSLMQHHTSLSFEPASESMWGYRSAVYFALVLEFCYGGKGKSLEKWQELADYHQKWLEFRPDVFEPIYYKDAQMDRFPSIYYLGSVHGKFVPQQWYQFFSRLRWQYACG